MRDLDRYSKELFSKTANFRLENILTLYQYPNEDEIHNMICGYSNNEFEDKRLFDYVESIDYLKYEKELWRTQKPK